MRQGVVVGLANHTVLIHRDGSEIPVDDSAAPIRDSGGKICGVVLVFRDVSDRKRMEHTERLLAEAKSVLAESLDLEKTLINIARLPVPVLADGCAVHVVGEGLTFERSVGFHSDSAKAEAMEAWLRAFPGRVDAEQGAGLVARTGRPQLYARVTAATLERMARNAEEAAMFKKIDFKSALIVPMRSRDQTLGVLALYYTRPDRSYGVRDMAFAQDVADQAALALDNALLYRQAKEALQARDEFLSIASHELKTPLTSHQLQVQGLLRLAEKTKGTMDERLRVALQAMKQQGDRMTRLIDGLLDVSRIASGKLILNREKVDLVKLTREVIARLAPEIERCASALTLQADQPIVGEWDAFRLEQVLLNLMSNACKYGQGKPIVVTLDQEDGWARLVVQDHGIGIAPEDLKRLFEPFERAVSVREYGGLGLGLYIVRRIVEAHEGLVQVRSEHGVGSVFTIKLPLKI
jgi:signal transduction histidine kinase